MSGGSGARGADARAGIERWLASHDGEVVAWRHHLHRNPELGHSEHATTSFVAEALRAAGLAPRILPGGTGLTVDLEPVGGAGDGPLVALRADLDALPIREASGEPFASEVDGVMHACGHDVHTASLLGAVLALASLPHLPGRIRAIFQPAEEVMTGAIAAIDAGVMHGVDQIFMLHVAPGLRTGTIGAATGPATSSSDAITVRLTGPGGHSSRPNDTADIVYALGSVITSLPALLTRRLDPLDAGVLVWGQVESGKTANVIPTEGLLRGTLRLGSREAWDEAPALVAELLDGVLAPTRASHELEYQRGVPPVVNDAAAVALASRVADDDLGHDAFVPLPRTGAGEDFAYYLDHAPGALISLGVWDGRGEPTSVHRDTFRADDAALAVGVRTYAGLALAAHAELAGAARPDA
ncbi:putative peptidase/amidohydrolase [Pseudoclavibacter endophyticus]|uniref:Amidohydrolase n=1 Tax=Pseudoclavibacter endophyticus TaxID=1778590 RepID=A0A6H9WIY7_9MICO|nr:amidohydrolase [Pseudoclavibacter endophyticus]KAB1646773.1 amidohydrolase [Pseudoclavibacter endophyticus]GGA75673.1 putative peptidase/amidohydrolase [Pseudoclavibacter endophyticus]